jgi:transposase-like protein
VKETTVKQDTPKGLGPVVQIDQERIKEHLGELVRGSVEETLNALLEAEADQLCQASRYERSAARVDTRAGHYQRKLHTKAGEVTLAVPKLRRVPFETAIIERYRRREASVEEALIEMYLAGVSVRRVEDITEALWGTRVSPGLVSKLNQKVYGRIEAWRNRKIEGRFAYLYLDGVLLKRSWGGEVRNLSVLVAVGVAEDGYRQILGVAEGAKEDYEGWRGFIKGLKDRGLKAVRLIISDACAGLAQAAAEHYPHARWQRCVVHFYRNVFTKVPRGRMDEVARMLKAIHAQEDLKSAQAKAKDVIGKLLEMKLRDAAQVLRAGVQDTLAYYAFPATHWRQIRTNNPLERIIREIRRRTRVVGVFPDGHAALMLVAARLRHIAATKWGTRAYMSMEPLLGKTALVKAA